MFRSTPLFVRATRLAFPAVCCCFLGAASAQPPEGPYQPDAFTSLLIHFDEGAGDQTVDVGPYGLRGSVQGATWAAGKFGGGLDCRQGAVSVRYHEALDVTEGLALEAWVWIDGPSPEIQRIAYRSSVYGLYLAARSTAVTFYVNTMGQWESVRADLPLKQWVHVAGTYDGSKMRLYVDGELQAETEKTGAVVQTHNPLEIGGEAASQQRFLNGRVDEVRLSHVARQRFDSATPEVFESTTEVRLAPVPEDPLSLALPRLTIGRSPAPTLDGRLDDAVWQDAAEVSFSDTPSGERPNQPTQAWLTYDDRALYLGVRCTEAFLDKLKAAVTEHDGPVWGDDCVEVLFKPTPGDPTYYHLAVNSVGTVYDARATKDPAWESGVEVHTAREERAWTLELALPFASVGGTPKVNSKWRLNLGREEKPLEELSSWAPVGGKFHSVGRFGWLVFGERPVAAAELTCSLLGRVVDQQGRGLRGLAVNTPVGRRRTDSFGYFRAEGLPREQVLLAVANPRYEPLAVTAELRQPTERVKLPALTPVDPNAVAFEVPPSPNGYRVFPVSPLDDLDLTTPFPASTEGAPLRAFATLGEYEPLGAVVLADQPLTQVEVSVTALTGPGGARLSEDALDLRVVKRYLRVRWYNSPPDDLVPSSRYLLRPQPFDMAAGTHRRLHLIVHVPETAAPGVYRGTLRVAPEGKPAAAVPVEFEVLNLRLDPPRKKYAAYYRGEHGNLSEALNEAVTRAELADLREHGATRLLGRARIGYRRNGDQIVPNYEAVREYLRLLKGAGFEPPFIIGTGFEQLAKLVGSEESEAFLRAGERALRRLLAVGKEEGVGEIVVTHMDEVFGKDRLDRYLRLTAPVRRVPGLRQYITFHTRPTPEVEEMTRRIDPFVDLRCYHGHSIDQWLAAGHSFEELAQKLKESGDEAWCYYNPRSVDVTPEWARLCNGFWLWLGPITTHCPWIYNSYRGDPLDDADGFDFGYAFPVPTAHGFEIVPTRLWEGYREGVDDERYLTTLENLMEKQRANPAKGEAVKSAEDFLAGLRKQLLDFELEVDQSVLVRAQAEKYAGADYAGWRRQCVERIEALR